MPADAHDQAHRTRDPRHSPVTVQDLLASYAAAHALSTPPERVKPEGGVPEDARPNPKD